jgi:diacylglycerol O-acyltransferase / trehalose O-mycolyltransferase
LPSASNVPRLVPLSGAEALEGTDLYISYGNGKSGPLDPPGASFDGGESWLTPQNDRLVARLEELGIPATVDAYGPGTHSWPYWERSLRTQPPEFPPGAVSCQRSPGVTAPR